ncbi:MAG: dialkylresorcinol condensing enzyme [Parahaliea sp.]
MKKILLIHYSQSGQLSDIAKAFTHPIAASSDVDLVIETLQPEKPFPFPWPFLQFLDTFPESVYLDPPPLKPGSLRGDEDFDLIILAYQVWFLSPSLPATAFLQQPLAKQLLKGKPVVTLIACRNMWLLAQEQVKRILAEDIGARLVGNVALTDEAGSLLSFFATPLWVLTGHKGPFLKGLIPRAGVSANNIQNCNRFGERICQTLQEGAPVNEHLLRGLGAVVIDEALIASEKTGRRAFMVWGRLLRLLGPPGSRLRKPVLVFYSVFLILMILTVVPLSMLFRKLSSPFSRDYFIRQKAYFSAPSGEDIVITDNKKTSLITRSLSDPG